MMMMMMMTLMRRAGALLSTAGLLVMLAAPALANSPGPITVDGVEYNATKVSGPTVHYETPDTNPQEAFTERNVWTGNGSEHLPCPAGIHWIDNKNVLTISNCLEAPVTTTTQPPGTTTTAAPPSTTTTSTVPPTTVTSTTAPQTTTEAPDCDEGSPTWNEETQDCRLPFTGPGDWVAPTALTGAGLMALGLALLALSRRLQNA